MFKNFNYKSDTDKILFLGFLLVLLITVSTLFLYGENRISKAGDIKSTFIAWEKLQLPPLNDLQPTDVAFHISNQETTANNYKLIFYLNKKTIQEETVTIPANQKKIILPPKKVIENIEEIKSTTNKEILYEIKISRQNKGKKEEEIIGHWLKPL